MAVKTVPVQELLGSRMVIIDPLGMVIGDVTAGADTTEISKK